MILKTPAIVINFKIYKEVVGAKGLELARICEAVASETDASIAIAPQMVDLGFIAEKVSIPVFAQHIDTGTAGAFTGFTSVEAVAGSGAVGTLINHSEHRIKISEIDELVQVCKKQSLITILCTNNLEVSSACAMLKPDFIAIEPPELIGGDISVTTADPDIVKNTVTEIKNLAPEVKVLTGAGIKTSEDVAKAIELGTDGVLLASGIVKAEDPRKALMDLVAGLK
ncbi:MAG: triose-phosphate isomerase [Thermoplasmata archaeon]|nr:MAG: triose-phosphate isomerase [Thermoplasmata archaeon]